MNRTKQRLLAVAIVVGSMVGSALALQVWPQGSGAESNPSIPVNDASGRVVFSIRNDDPDNAIVVTGFTEATGGSSSGCPNLNTPVPLSGSLPVTINPGAQVQFVTTLASAFTSTGDYVCTYNVVLSSGGTPPQVPITYHVVATEDFDLQPKVMNFGSQTSPNSEQQTAVITGYGSAQSVTAMIENDPTSNFEMTCGNGSSCSVSTTGGGGTSTVQVRCKGTTPATATADLNVYATMLVEMTATKPHIPVPMPVLVGTTTLLCDAFAAGGSISLDPDPVTITAAENTLGSASVSVLGSGSTASAAITGSPQFAIEGCGASCAFDQTLPTSLVVDCTPTSSTTSATLTVTHSLGGSASATVFCTPTASPGMLFVDSTTIHFGSIAVGSMGSGDRKLKLKNIGGQPLTGVTITFPGSSDYYAEDCTTANPCTLSASGGSNSTQDVTLWFKPLVHGSLDASAMVTANGSGTGASVLLDGTGLGGVMIVTQPSAATQFELDLGTIPKGQTASGAVKVRNDGNALFTAAVSGAAAPYTVTPSELAIPETTTGAFTVTCSSSTPSANNDQSWSVTSDAYLGSPQTVTVSCSIADTTINVNPLSFDFGEVRVGTTAQEMTVTISNPATNGTAALIKSMQLHEPKTGLSLVPPTTTNLTLEAGSSTTATLRLETAEDSDLTGELLDIEVDNAQLALPVRGKVVTPHSRVVPERLDLGTACSGTQVTGTVMLINDGTATLGVDPPQMSESFLAATPGALFPLALPPSMSVTAEVSPVVSANGSLEGVLTWRDDVPSLYEVPVILEYVTSGTALSPRALDFGVVAVGMPPTSQRVNLENCDPDISKITVKSLRGIRGPIGAWQLEPKVGYERQLGAHETQAVSVAFKPPGRGRYEAELQIITSAGPQTVLLVGEATGRDFDETSFYTCACSTPGTPWAGWPLPAALAVIIVRRRRGSSSSR